MRFDLKKLFIFPLILMGCSNPKSFDSFESKKWILDEKTCTSYRERVISSLEREFDKFIGLTENELVELLGTPYKTELYTRGQKFTFYRIQCKDKNENPDELKFRISALGMVNEVLIWIN